MIFLNRVTLTPISGGLGHKNHCQPGSGQISHMDTAAVTDFCFDIDFKV